MSPTLETFGENMTFLVFTIEFYLRLSFPAAGPPSKFDKSPKNYSRESSDCNPPPPYLVERPVIPFF